MKVILTSTTKHFKNKLEKKGLIVFEYLENRDGKNEFPDTEVFVKLPEELLTDPAERIVIIHSGQINPNKGLLELEQILQILKNNNIDNIELFFTYFPYSMQDKEFSIGETAYARDLVEKFTAYYGVKKMYIIDPHFGNEAWAKDYNIVQISALGLLKHNFSGDVLYLSPDEGGIRRTGIKGFLKKRLNSYDVILEGNGFDVSGRTVCIVDDLVETGGTMCRVCDALRNKGAKKVVALITHGVLETGILRLNSTYDEFYLTNTINRKEANVDVSDLIVGALRE